jgi:hypothetical protein
MNFLGQMQLANSRALQNLTHVAAPPNQRMARWVFSSSRDGGMPDLHLELSDDRSTLTMKALNSDEKTSGMTAEAVQQLIAVLAAARAIMTPPIPQTNPAAGEPTLSRDPMRWWVGPDYRPTHLCLALLHPGLGWVSTALQPDDARELIAGLQLILERRATLH